MEIRKLLIADPSTVFCAMLSEALGGGYELRFCNDGHRALALLEEFQPDVLVTDLALPGLDGISVLRSAAACASPPVRLVTTRFSSPYIENALSELGVDYLMLKPCDIRALAERIRDMSGFDSVSTPMACGRTALANLLLALGVPVGRKGYSYLEAAVELYRQDPGRSVTKELYPAVARLYKTNAASVERAIRGAVQAAWEQRDEALWRRYFMPSRSGTVPRPTNRVFIATVSEVIGGQQQRQA